MITQQQLRAWSDTYQQKVKSKLDRSVSTERERRQVSGQMMCLLNFIQSLDFLNVELTPQQLEVEIEQMLTKLADTKIYYLIEYVRGPVAQEQVWWAEGILLQAEQTWEELRQILPTAWQKARVWGHYYQLYQYRGGAIDEAALHWHLEREKFFEEVGVVRLERNDDLIASLNMVLSISTSEEERYHWAWVCNKEVCWVRPGKEPRSTSVGDVIVPVFGEAWMVNHRGFRRLSTTPLPSAHQIEQQIKAPRSRQLRSLLANWVSLFLGRAHSRKGGMRGEA